MFSQDELQRYARQMAVPEFGAGGQERLRVARVLLIGAGGLGSPAALYLAAAGVGTLGIVDADDVELSKLHRQLLHGTDDVGRPKVKSARRRLGEVNPHVLVEPITGRFTAANALDLARGWGWSADAAFRLAFGLFGLCCLWSGAFFVRPPRRWRVALS